MINDLCNFIKNNKLLCLGTAGFAIVGFLGYRAVVWLNSVLKGTTQKTDEIAKKHFKREEQNDLNGAAPKSTAPTATNVEKTPKPAPTRTLAKEIEFSDSTEKKIFKAKPFYSLPFEFMKTTQGGFELAKQKLKEKLQNPLLEGNERAKIKKELAKLEKHALDGKNVRAYRTSLKWMNKIQDSDWSYRPQSAEPKTLGSEKKKEVRWDAGTECPDWRKASIKEIREYHEFLYQLHFPSFNLANQPFAPCRAGLAHIMPTNDSFRELATYLENHPKHKFSKGTIRVANKLVDWSQELASLTDGRYAYIVPTHSSWGAELPRTADCRDHIVAVAIEKLAGVTKIAILDSMPTLDSPANPERIGIHLDQKISFSPVELILSYIAEANINPETTEIFYPHIRRQEYRACWVFAFKDAVAFLRTPDFFQQISQTAPQTQT